MRSINECRSLPSNFLDNSLDTNCIWMCWLFLFQEKYILTFTVFLTLKWHNLSKLNWGKYREHIYVKFAHIFQGYINGPGIFHNGETEQFQWIESYVMQIIHVKKYTLKLKGRHTVPLSQLKLLKFVVHIDVNCPIGPNIITAYGTPETAHGQPYIS